MTKWTPIKATKFLILESKDKAFVKEKKVNQLLFDYPNVTRKEEEMLINEQ